MPEHTETLREIVEGMLHGGLPYGTEKGCSKCRLEKLLCEADCDLVKKWRRRARADCDPASGSVVIQAKGQVESQCADELETWLAVNLPRIKAEARLEEHTRQSKGAGQ